MTYAHTYAHIACEASDFLSALKIPCDGTEKNIYIYMVHAVRCVVCSVKCGRVNV